MQVIRYLRRKNNKNLAREKLLTDPIPHRPITSALTTTENKRTNEMEGKQTWS